MQLMACGCRDKEEHHGNMILHVTSMAIKSGSGQDYEPSLKAPRDPGRIVRLSALSRGD